MTLAIDAKKATILDVVNAVEPLQCIKTCPLNLATHGTRLCPVHRRLDNALALVEKAFGGTTLAEILSDRNGSVPLCEV